MTSKSLWNVDGVPSRISEHSGETLINGTLCRALALSHLRLAMSLTAGSDGGQQPVFRGAATPGNFDSGAGGSTLFPSTLIVRLTIIKFNKRMYCIFAICVALNESHPVHQIHLFT